MTKSKKRVPIRSYEELVKACSDEEYGVLFAY